MRRVDADERTDSVNPRMADMLGYSPKEMIGRKLSEFTDPEAPRAAHEGLESTRSEARSELLEHCFCARHFVLDTGVAKAAD